MQYVKDKIDMLKTTLTILLALLLYNHILFSQDYKADIEAVINTYQATTYDVAYEYVFYPSYTSTEALERASIQVRRDGKLFRIKQFGMEVISNADYTLIISENTGLIAIDKRREKKEASGLDEQFRMDLQSKLENIGKQMGWDTLAAQSDEMYFDVVYNGETNGIKSYTFNYYEGDVSKAELYINATKKTLHKQVLFYREPFEVNEGEFANVRIEIDFMQQDFKPRFDADTFEIDSYLSIGNNGKVTLKGKYKNFRIINHLENF